jgi:hypothetical protein
VPNTLAAVVASMIILGGGSQPGSTRVPAGEAASARPAFAASVHGFRFHNSFRGSPLPPALAQGTSPLAAAVREALAGAELPDRYGLCGGMSAAAGDYYLAGVPIPTEATPPAQGTPLYEYLYQRQTDSLGPSAAMALKFWKWMHLPTEAAEGESTQGLTAREWPTILARLGAVGVTPVGLVYVRGARNRTADESRPGDLWDNHQVLAIGCEEKTTGVVHIRVYDPNYPGNDQVTLVLEPVGEERPARAYRSELRLGGGRVRPVRGCFAMPYVPRTPPPEPRADLKDP